MRFYKHYWICIWSHPLLWNKVHGAYWTGWALWHWLIRYLVNAYNYSYDFQILSTRGFCLIGIFLPLENFSRIWRRNPCRWRAANFDMCSALMAIEQWGFFSVPQLLWYGESVYSGHLRGPVTLTPISERLAVELSLPVFLRLEFEHPTCRLGERSNPLRHRSGSRRGNQALTVTWVSQTINWDISVSMLGKELHTNNSFLA